MPIPKYISERSSAAFQIVTYEAREKTLGYVTAALGLIAGLAWNDAVKAFIEYVFPVKANSVAAKFLYALLMTGVLAIASSSLAKLFKNEKEEKTVGG